MQDDYGFGIRDGEGDGEGQKNIHLLDGIVVTDDAL